MDSTLSASSSIELTPKRLRFLYGDLRFAKKDIEKLTLWPRSAINTLLKNPDLRLGYPIHRDMTSRNFTDLKQRLALNVDEHWQSWSGRRKQYRNAFMAKAVSEGLDWQALDQFIAEMPALQDQEAEERRRLEEQHYLPHPIVLELMVRRSSDDLYLARRTETGGLRLISGNLKYNAMRRETIGAAARRILHAEFGINASFTEVLDIKLEQKEGQLSIKTIVVLTVNDLAAEMKPKKGWRWVEFSKLLDPWDYPMRNYL
jgi:hypothetical protein